MEQLVLPSGTVITCPTCDREMAISLADMFPSEFNNGLFRGLAWSPIDPKPICPFCGDYFAITDVEKKRYSIHTKGGWF